jgi:hypothetical protein
MLFETRIRNLCWELESSDDDARAIEILKELQKVIHEQIEQINHEVNGLRRLIRPGTRSSEVHRRNKQSSLFVLSRPSNRGR